MAASGRDLLDRQYLDMRARCLSLAADLDRIERAAGGPALLASDQRIAQLRRAMQIILQEQGATRAEKLQLLLSDQSAPPATTTKSR